MNINEGKPHLIRGEFYASQKMKRKYCQRNCGAAKHAKLEKIGS